MKKMKYLKIVFLSLLLSFGINEAIFADDTTRVDIDRYTPNENSIDIFVNHNKDENSWINEDSTKVFLGSEELPINSIITFGDSQRNITYKCIIDVSGSMDDSRVAYAADVIDKIAELKRPEDLISITAMANDIVRSGYLEDANEITTNASMVKRTSEDTNLYHTIVDEIGDIQTAKEVGEKRCIIIFSDGAEDQATGITREEAIKAVEDSHVPIFTVGLLKKNHKSENEEAAKILGSFARISSGGKHYVPVLDGSNVDSISEDILNTIYGSVVINTGIPTQSFSQIAHEIKVKVNTSNGMVEDIIPISESDIKKIEKAQEKIMESKVEAAPEVKPEPMPEPTPEPTQEPVEKTGNVTKMIVLGLCVLILIVILFGVIYLYLKNNKIKKYEELDESYSDAQNIEMGSGGSTENFSDYGGDTGAVGETVGLTGDFNDYGGATSSIVYDGVANSPEKHISGQFYVTLTRLGKIEEENSTFNFTLSNEYSIGRSASKADLAFSNDNALSGKHCTLFVKDGHIFIRDEGSTNGTFVNGVAISGQFKVEQDDVILIGSYEYRIVWSK